MALPAPYAALAEGILGASPPEEPLSDCSACPCAGVTLNVEFRCCESEAEIPNFQVGRALGVPSLRARLAARRGVSPLGMRRVRPGPCPHVDAAGCTIHPARPALCATWFCRTTRAEAGQAAWRALGELLRMLDGRLALWAARESGLDVSILRTLLAPPEARPPDDGPVDDAAWAARFGPWAGREEEYFAACTARVAELPADRAIEIAGVEARVLADAARRAFESLARGPIPDRLLVGQHTVVGLGPGALRVVTTNRHQPLDVSRRAHGLLACFDGRPTAEALAALAADPGVERPEDLVRVLLDHRLLVPAAPPAAGRSP